MLGVLLMSAATATKGWPPNRDCIRVDEEGDPDESHQDLGSAARPWSLFRARLAVSLVAWVRLYQALTARRRGERFVVQPNESAVRAVVSSVCARTGARVNKGGVP
jgi:hypothetical protein